MVTTIIMTSSFSTISTYGSKMYSDLFEIYNDLIFTKCLNYWVLIYSTYFKIVFCSHSLPVAWQYSYFSEAGLIYHPPSCTNYPRLAIYLLSVSIDYLPHNCFNINCVFMLKLQFHMCYECLFIIINVNKYESMKMYLHYYLKNNYIKIYWISITY